MRSLALSLPLVLVASAAALAVPATTAAPPLFALIGAGADTGDTALGRTPQSGAGMECPMPVERPDSNAASSMPNTQAQTPRGGVVILTAPAPRVSDMPIARANCWNPLDRPVPARSRARPDGH